MFILGAGNVTSGSKVFLMVSDLFVVIFFFYVVFYKDLNINSIVNLW